MFKTVTLKSGYEIYAPSLMTVAQNLRSFSEEVDSVGLKELYAKAKDETFVLSAKIAQLASAYDLLNGTYMHEIIREVILNCIQEDAAGVYSYVSPEYDVITKEEKEIAEIFEKLVRLSSSKGMPHFTAIYDWCKNPAILLAELHRRKNYRNMD